MLATLTYAGSCYFALVGEGISNSRSQHVTPHEHTSLIRDGHISRRVTSSLSGPLKRGAVIVCSQNKYSFCYSNSYAKEVTLPRCYAWKIKVICMSIRPRSHSHSHSLMAGTSIKRSPINIDTKGTPFTLQWHGIQYAYRSHEWGWRLVIRNHHQMCLLPPYNLIKNIRDYNDITTCGTVRRAAQNFVGGTETMGHFGSRTRQL